MNITAWSKTLLGAVVVSMSLTATTAYASHNYAVGKHKPAKGVYDYARVLSAEPVIRYVNVSTPVEECWEETRYYTVDHRPGTAGGAIVGAIVGGVVGHQFGSGSGNDAATVAGTLIGAAIGSDTARRRAYTSGTYGTTRHAEPVRRCETKYRTTREERIDGYRVIYAYHGQKYATDMPYDPGRKLRIRVDVRPAGH